MDDLNKKIGSKVKSIREQKKLTLEQTSVLTNVSKGMLSKIETGSSSPTVSVLWKIATGLNVAFSYFMEEEDNQVTIVRKNEAQSFVENSDDMQVYPLFSYDDERRFEVFTVELEAMATHNSQAHRSNVEEYIIANDPMEVLIGDNKTKLNKGDALRYIANIEHSYINKSSRKISFQHIIYYHK